MVRPSAKIVVVCCGFFLGWKSMSKKTCHRGRSLNPARMFSTIIAGINPASTSSNDPNQIGRGNVVGDGSSITSSSDSG